MFHIFITFWILCNLSWEVCEDTTFWLQEKIAPKFFTVKHHSKPKGFSAEFFIVPIHMALVLETFIFKPKYFSKVLKLSNSSFAEVISENNAVMSSA